VPSLLASETLPYLGVLSMFRLLHGNESFNTYTNAAPSLPNNSNLGLAYFFSTLSEVGYIVKYTKQYSIHKVNTGSHH